jgi:HlyD family secretion protein
MKLFKVVIVVGGLVLAGGWGYERWGGEEDAGRSASDEMLFTVRRGNLNVTLKENGTLVAKDAQKISSGTDSGSKITYLIEEGTNVEEGDLLCELDPSDVETQIERLEQEVIEANLRVNTSHTELEIQKAENTANIDKARIALDKAQQEKERYEEGDAPNERRKLDVAIKQAETEFSRKKKKYADSQMLFEKTYINKSELEQNQIDFEKAEVELESAKLALEIFEKYTYPMTITERDAAVRDKQREKDNAELRAENYLNQKTVSVEQNEKRLTLLKKELDKEKEELAKMTLIAPSPGIVLYGDPDEPWNVENIRLGGDVWGNMVLFTLPDLRVMQVKIQVHEADINKIEEGQSAKITMDTYPGVVLDGQVTRIASVAGGGRDRWSRSSNEVKKFNVEVTLDEQVDLKLKPGISAKAEVFIDRREDTLFIPLQCVFEEEGQQYCWVMNGGGEPERLAISAGLSNDTYIEILDGLTEGDRVLLYNPKLPVPSSGESPEAEDADSKDDASGGKGGGKGGKGAAEAVTAST